IAASAVGDNMKAISAIIITCLSFGSVLSGSESLDRARQLLKSGDAPAAKTLLAQAAQRNPKDVATLSEYAEFLDQFGDPAARPAPRLRPNGRDIERFGTRRSSLRAGAHRRHERLPGVPQQRRAGADGVPEAGAPLSRPGAGAR